jgi:LAO/AO transport system kinase
LNTETISSLVDDSIQREKFSIAKIITELEKKDSFEFRKTLFSELEKKGKFPSGFTIGITGTPGAGKSSLLGEITNLFLEQYPNSSLAIVAIDPSSAITGGSILGDRTRLNFPRREKKVYFRSQPSQLDLGGVNPSTFQVIRFLKYLFEFVFVETVGIGQNEIEISHMTDYSFLVLQPLGGDQIQFMKSGIMEIPNAFIINKCDEEALSSSSYHNLVSTLSFIKNILKTDSLPPIYRTSVTQHKGIEELLKDMMNLPSKIIERKDSSFQLHKSLEEEYGKWGVKQFWNRLQKEGYQSYEEGEEKLRKWLSEKGIV